MSLLSIWRFRPILYIAFNVAHAHAHLISFIIQNSSYSVVVQRFIKFTVISILGQIRTDWTTYVFRGNYAPFNFSWWFGFPRMLFQTLHTSNSLTWLMRLQTFSEKGFKTAWFSHFLCVLNFPQTFFTLQLVCLEYVNYILITVSCSIT